MFLQDLFENTGLLPLYQCASAGHAVNGFGSEVAFPDNLAVNRRFVLEASGLGCRGKENESFTPKVRPFLATIVTPRIARAADQGSGSDVRTWDGSWDWNSGFGNRGHLFHFCNSADRWVSTA